MSAFGLFSDGGNCADIGVEITLRIGLVRAASPSMSKLAVKPRLSLDIHPLDGFVDGPAHDEYLPHQPHRRPDRLPDKRFARARDQALQAAIAVAQNCLTQAPAPRSRY